MGHVSWCLGAKTAVLSLKLLSRAPRHEPGNQRVGFVSQEALFPFLSFLYEETFAFNMLVLACVGTANERLPWHPTHPQVAVRRGGGLLGTAPGVATANYPWCRACSNLPLAQPQQTGCERTPCALNGVVLAHASAFISLLFPFFPLLLAPGRQRPRGAATAALVLA